MLHFWFEFASTYSYLAAMRIEEAAAARAVSLRWRPFLLGPVFKAQGWDTSPFNIYEAKGRYMWRDVARQAAALGLAFVPPEPFPQNGLRAARIAVAAAAEPWMPGFCKGVFAAEFAQGRDISEEATLADILEGLGQDVPAWLARTNDPAVKQALRHQTDEAMMLGIFGAPSFTVEGELFWGNDRLEQALDWAAGDRALAAGV